MRTHGADNGGGMAAATKHVADHAVALARLELKLAVLEVKRKVTALGIGVALLVGAALFILFGLGFALAAAAAALATLVSTWLALLIVAGAVVLFAGMLGVLGLGSVKRGAPPVPEQAIAEAKLTTEAVKANGHSRSTS
jgi:hypothetical protein